MCPIVGDIARGCGRNTNPGWLAGVSWRSRVNTGRFSMCEVSIRTSCWTSRMSCWTSSMFFVMPACASRFSERTSSMRRREGVAGPGNENTPVQDDGPPASSQRAFSRVLPGSPSARPLVARSYLSGWSVSPPPSPLPAQSRPPRRSGPGSSRRTRSGVRTGGRYRRRLTRGGSSRRGATSRG